MTRTHEGATDTILAINQDRVDDDPDLLRQWIHHRRAELTFTHWALGLEPRRFLLDPENTRIARSRRRLAWRRVWHSRSRRSWPRKGDSSLAGSSRSGSAGRTTSIRPTRARLPDDAEARALGLLHLETIGDLALLCLTWKPDGLRPGLVEEVLTFLAAEGPFFDDRLLREALQGYRDETAYPLKLLMGFINDSLGLDPVLARTH